MKCIPSIFVSHMNIKVVFLFKDFAKIQMSMQCCNMKAVPTLIIFLVNISSYMTKIFKQIVTARSCRIMKCCPSFVVSHMNIKVAFIFKNFAKIQMSIQRCNMKTVRALIIFTVNIRPFHIRKICK